MGQVFLAVTCLGAGVAVSLLTAVLLRWLQRRRLRLRDSVCASSWEELRSLAKTARANRLTAQELEELRVHLMNFSMTCHSKASAEKLLSQVAHLTGGELEPLLRTSGQVVRERFGGSEGETTAFAAR